MPSLREAEAALRNIRRRYWTIRRVSFAIAYTGVFTVLLVAPWIAAGYVMWRSGVFARLQRQFFSSVDNGMAVLPLPSPTPSPTPTAALNRWLITEDEGTAWLVRILGTPPAIQQAKVRFLPGSIEVTGVVAIPAPHPLVMQLTPHVTAGAVGVTITRVSVGLIPDPAAEAFVRPYLETWANQLAAEMNRPYAYVAVQVDEGTLSATGSVRP